MPDGPAIGATTHERFFQRLPATIADGPTVEQRTAHPLTSFGNVLFIAAGIAIFYVLSAIALLLYAQLLDF